MQKLLTIGGNTKINKSDKSGKGYKTAVLHLAPYKLSGKNVCPHASQGCREACLNTAGRGRFNNVQEARIKKTQLFLNNKELFLRQLRKEIEAFEKHCEKRNLKPCIRLNGTSDIPWENLRINDLSLIDMFKGVQFYDYTKSKKRAIRASRAKEAENSFVFPLNYHLTFSRSEDTTKREARELVSNGVNIAVVFENIPVIEKGEPIINGDIHDLRFLDDKGKDGKGLIVALSAKGKAKKDTSGFVVSNRKVQEVKKEQSKFNLNN